MTHFGQTVGITVEDVKSLIFKMATHPEENGVPEAGNGSGQRARCEAATVAAEHAVKGVKEERLLLF